MTDRELLELAAKAAGLRGRWNREVACIRLLPGKKTPYGMVYSYWDPLSDGDAALRLAVKLSMTLAVGDVDEEGSSSDAQLQNGRFGNVPHGKDPYAATRRAIVTAAANLERPNHERL